MNFTTNVNQPVRLVSIGRKLQAWREKFFVSLFRDVRISLNIETKNFSRFACSLHLMETSQGNVQHTAKHVTNMGNEIILLLYAEAILQLDLMQGKSMRSQPALHCNQTQAFYEYIPFVGGKTELRQVKNAVNTTGMATLRDTNCGSLMFC